MLSLAVSHNFKQIISSGVDNKLIFWRPCLFENSNTVRDITDGSFGPFYSKIWNYTKNEKNENMKDTTSNTKLFAEASMNFELRPSKTNVMHLLAQSGNDEGIRICIENGMNLFYEDQLKMTPLHYFLEKSTNLDCLNEILNMLVDHKSPYVFDSLSLLTPYIYKLNDPRIGDFLDKCVIPV